MREATRTFTDECFSLSNIQWDSRVDRNKLKFHRLHIARQPRRNFHAAVGETVVCQKRTSTHRIVFMGMMNELAVSPSTQPSERHSCLWPRWAIQTRFLDFRQTRIRKDLAVRQVNKPSNPGGNWVRKAFQIMETHTESGRPAIQERRPSSKKRSQLRGRCISIQASSL